MIDSLYYGSKPCPCCAGKPSNSGGIKFSPEVLQGFLENIYEGFDASNELEARAWREVLRVMNQGAVEGLSKSKSPEKLSTKFLKSVRHSNEVFSAFKVHAMGKAMQAKLFDGKGKLRPFDEWKKLVAPIASHHVGAWLRTEYDTAVIRAHQAADWQDFIANKDILPNLRWMPTTSPTPDGAHKSFWERQLTLPIDDPFWATQRPGNRWNCKCSLDATDTPISVDASDVRDDTAPTAQRGLATNPKDGILIDDKHPYFPETCSACPYYQNSRKGIKGMLMALLENRKKDCLACQLISQNIEGQKSASLKLTDEQKAHRKALQDEARKKFQGKEIETDIGIVTITAKGIKEFLNQPNARYFEKNELVKELDNLIREAKYIGYTDYHKENNSKILYSHLFEISKPGWEGQLLIVREDLSGMKTLYSITDNPDRIQGIKKK